MVSDKPGELQKRWFLISHIPATVNFSQENEGSGCVVGDVTTHKAGSSRIKRDTEGVQKLISILSSGMIVLYRPLLYYSCFVEDDNDGTQLINLAADAVMPDTTASRLLRLWMCVRKCTMAEINQYHISQLKHLLLRQGKGVSELKLKNHNSNRCFVVF